jgi:hypothetical protein
MEKTEQKGRKRLVIACCILVNLALLFWFKYINFFRMTAGYFTGVDYRPLNVILPVGISFYTFQALGYAIDWSREFATCCPDYYVHEQRMFTRLMRKGLAYRRNAKFLMNDATVAAIRKLKDGNGVYMWQPALTSGQPDKLLGYDLITTSHAPDIESGARVAAFGDFSYYWIGDRTGLSVQRLNERYADQGVIAFKAFERTDGKVVMPEAIQILKMKA